MKVLLIFASLITVFASCSADISSSNNDSDSTAISQADSIADSIQDDGELQSNALAFQAEYRRLLSVSPSIPLEVSSYTEALLDTQASGDYRIYTYQVHQSKQFVDLKSFGANDDILWPGNVLNGLNLAKSNQYSPISLKRAPVTISLSLETSGSKSSNSNMSALVVHPSLSTIREAIADIIAKNSSSSLPTQVEYDYTNAYDTQQLGLSLGIPQASLTGQSLDMGWNNSTTRSRILFTFKQIAFTADVNTPDSLFSATNSIAELNAALGSKISPVYVASVDYGAVYYLSVESSLSNQDLEANLGIGASVIVPQTSMTSKNTTVKFTQAGGAPQLGDQLTAMLLQTGGAPQLQALLKGQNLASSLAVPIQYRLRNASDNSLATIAMSGDYTMTKYVKVNQTVSISFDRFQAYKMTDGSGVPEFTANLYVYANSKGRDSLINTYSLSGAGVSYTVNPNKTWRFTFLDFKPSTDKIYIEASVIEKDLFADDRASSTKDILYPDWNDTTSLQFGTGAAGGIFDVTVSTAGD